MPRPTVVFCFLILALAFAGPGCDAGHDHDHDHDHSAGDHAHGEGDGDHDHDHDHDAHGEAHSLGKVVIGATTLEVTQFGGLEGGKEANFDFVVSAGNADTIRTWVGVQNGRGSIKALAEKMDDKKFHAHAECPLVIGADHLLWIEVEDAGKKQINGVPLHR